MASDILIVDDEDSVRQLLKMMLRPFDVNFREASDGLQGLDEVRRDKPSLIILDVMMPRMDGLTMLKTLRADPNTEAIPVLLFTAFRLAPEQVAELKLSPSMIMSKGTLSVRDIRSKVGGVLQIPNPV